MKSSVLSLAAAIAALTGGTLGFSISAARSAPEPEFPRGAVQQWFSTEPTNRPAPAFGREGLSREESRHMSTLVLEACREGARSLGWDRLLGELPVPMTGRTNPPSRLPAKPPVLKADGFEMPFVMLVRGSRPTNGWPLFLSLHGGGGNAQATGPHAWNVNTREWQAQLALFDRVYEPAGIYFIPRMADDRKGRWYLDHNQLAFEQVIRSALLFHDVDPNRVYLMGISEGGYGAIRFAGNRPDRFAACNGMAAAEPLNTSPPENMRNVALRIDIGEQDTMFDRVGLARRMGARLGELKKDDPRGYEFLVNVQAGRGHGINYAPGPKWIAERRRNPWPDRVNWTVRPFDKLVALQSYWLALPEKPARLPLFLTAAIQGNSLAITAEVPAGEKSAERIPAKEGRLLVRLNDTMLDLDQPVAVTVNGRSRGSMKAVRRLNTLVRTMGERSDANYMFPAELEVSLGD